MENANSTSNITLGAKIETKTSYCPGVIIFSTEYAGTITKVNKKSFIATFDTFRQKKNAKIIREGKTCNKVKFIYWKTVNGKDFYKSEGNLYGIAEF